MAVYNAEKFLREAVDSVLSQTFTDFEFLIIDDGSTDGSTRILQKYEKRDPRIRLVVQQNIGLTKTLNKGLELARGELIARMDADDISLPERFEKQVAFLDAHPDVAVLGTRYSKIDHRGRTLTPMMEVPCDHEAIVVKLLEGSSCLCHPTVMFRARQVRELGMYNSTVERAQDFELWLRVIDSHQVANLPEVLVRYRDHPGAVSTHAQEKQRATMERYCNEARARRGMPPIVRKPHRPVTREGKLLELVRIGWAAFHRGDRGMMLDYGWRAVRLAPASGAAWNLLLCGLVKRMPRSPSESAR